MYCHGLGLKRIACFSHHDGFSGVMLGAEELCCHIEFTQCHTHPVLPSPSAEDLLVFYIADQQQWALSCHNMVEAGFIEVEAFNQYWQVNGLTYEDHDGYRIVLQNTTWPVVNVDREAIGQVDHVGDS
ncbi:VOC family protein [Acerihabitans sp. TG2]|uniref:VOC family protein n=1 Tax=Acerihabitans sp. TG2 TaxID=3096008 RepID=UPI003A599BE6